METTSPTPEAKEILDPQSVVIITPTFYKTWSMDERTQPDADIERGDASISTFRKATNAGYRTVVVDGGSSKEYLDELQKLGITVLPQKEKGIAAAKRQALEAAITLEGSKVILLTQPEKDDVIKDVPDLANPILNGQADIVIPTREPNLFKETFPSFQYKSEVWANKWCNRIAHSVNMLPKDVNLDWFFGVKVLKNDPQIVELFMRKYSISDLVLAAKKSMDPERYSNVDFFPVLNALTSGKKVIGIEIPFHYPAGQKRIEEALIDQFMNKRIMQRQSLLGEFVQYARLITNNPKNQLIQIMEQEVQNFQHK